MKKVSLTRSSFPRTARLRPVSDKTAKVNRAYRDKRQEYVNRDVCVMFKAKLVRVVGLMFATDVHEIHGGSVRQRTKLDPRYWLRVQRASHDELQVMPKPKQWALKVLFDPENFDPAALSDLPGVYVDPLEVLREIAAIRSEQ